MNTIGRSHRGFTLLELMITIVVLAVLSAIAIPAFSGTMKRSNVANASNNLTTDLQFARGEAASQHRYVSLCRSTDGGNSCAVLATAADYDLGWMVYSYDVGASGADQVYSASVASMTVLKRGQTLTGASVQASDGKIITFNQTGGFVTNGTRTEVDFRVCARARNDTSAGVGTNTAGVPGTQLTLRASGSVAPTALVTGTLCSF